MTKARSILSLIHLFQVELFCERAWVIKIATYVMIISSLLQGNNWCRGCGKIEQRQGGLSLLEIKMIRSLDAHSRWICYQFCNELKIESLHSVAVYIITTFCLFFMLIFNSQIDDFSAARSSESKTELKHFNSFAELLPFNKDQKKCRIIAYREGLWTSF